MGMIVTAYAPNFDFFNYYTELVITPMLFFSGVFFPLDNFPGWMKTLAQFLPLTHAVEVSRAVYAGVYPKGLLLNLAFILAVTCVAFRFGVMRMKKRLIK